MNLIDFHVIEIISEERDKVWKLYGMSEKELEKEKEDEDSNWVKHLLSDGLKQKYKYWDDGGEFIGENVFNLTRGDKPYFVGYVGQHQKVGDNLRFEYYVLNHNFNRDKIELFNIFDNYYVQEQTEKEIRKYIRSPKIYKYDSFFKDEEPVYGFDGLCKRFERILMEEEWGRCEYEIAVGGIFITELSDIIREVERGKIAIEDVYEEIKKQDKRNYHLEKWDCFQQAQKNIPMIMRECIRQYKEQKKAKDGE